MKIQKNFTTGILTGICALLLVFVLTGATTKENTNTTPIYEFIDLGDKKGLIFNKVTGEIKYGVYVQFDGMVLFSRNIEVVLNN